MNPVVRAGWAGVVAGPLLALSVGIELVSDVQRPDGTVTAPALFAVLMVLWALGMACVATTVLGLRRLHTDASRPLPRVGRAGVRVTLAGCLLLLAFPVLGGLTAALSGKPADIVFLPFGIGFLCLIVGGVLLGRGVRRADVLRPAAVPLWFGAGSAFLAIAVPADPWHDLALFAFHATWTALGLLLIRHAARGAGVTPAHEQLSV
ncbi:MAG TPA: hypothetical protein VF423_02305 [Actinomycetes bacterium]